MLRAFPVCRTLWQVAVGFVNYHKRAVTLPEGCKDLIDLLRSNRSPTLDVMASPVGKAQVVHGDSELGSLSNIRNYVEKVFNGGAAQCVLTIVLEREELTLFLCRIPEPAGLNASVWFPDDLNHVMVMRAFFLRWNLEVPPEGSVPFKIHSAKIQRTWQVSPKPPARAQFTE